MVMKSRYIHPITGICPSYNALWYLPKIDISYILDEPNHQAAKQTSGPEIKVVQGLQRLVLLLRQLITLGHAGQLGLELGLIVMTSTSR